MEDGLVQAEFFVIVTNAGEAAATESLLVRFSIDGESPLEVGTIDPLEGGETTNLQFAQSLEAGSHVAVVSVMDAQYEIEVDARTAEISLEVTGHEVVEDGLTHLLVNASNNGELAASSIVLSSYWESRAEEEVESVSGGEERAAVIDSLEPGGSTEILVPLRVPTGSYHVELVAHTQSVETIPDDNLVHATADVEYVQLATSVEDVRHLGYAETGEGLVEIDLRVTNEGVAPGMALTVGLDCADSESVGCSQTVTTDLIPAGEGADFTLAVTVPQGATKAVVYAGELEDGFWWGPNNVAELTLEVPEHPATRLALEVEASPRDEYWSDGTANVDVAFSLRNEGYAPLEGEQTVTFACLREEKIVEGCGGEATVSLEDGFGPSVAEPLILRMPMGATLMEAEYGAEEADNFEVTVPERILGVERDVWECFSDRPGSGADNEGCGGWFSETIVKWDQSKPVKVWSTGDEDYIAILKESLEELAPLLNLEFQHVDSEDEADIRALSGVSIEEAKGLDFYCEHSWGCASWWGDVTNVIDSGTIGVWPTRDYFDDSELQALLIRRVTDHEVLHALVPIGHREDPLSQMSVTGLMMAKLNPMDEALIRLHSNPLLKPGMIMEEVAELIILQDELQDPPPPVDAEETPLDLVKNAYLAFREAETVGFTIRGSWVGCGHEFDSAKLQFASLASGAANVIRFKDRAVNAYIISERPGGRPTEYWRSIDGTWQTVYSSDIFGDTAWRRGFSNPFTMFNSVIVLAEPDRIRLSEPEPGVLRLDVYLEKTLVNVGWSNGGILTSNLTIDAETYEILSYFMSWQFDPDSEGTCSSYASKATKGEYGIDIEIPSFILRDSPILRSLDLE